jgi:DNA-binding transcriptional regulator YhcF (GntR family)
LKIAIAIGHIDKKRLREDYQRLAREGIVVTLIEKGAFLAAQNLSLWQYRMCSCNTLFLAKSSNLESV